MGSTVRWWNGSIGETLIVTLNNSTTVSAVCTQSGLDGDISNTIPISVQPAPTLKETDVNGQVITLPAGQILSLITGQTLSVTAVTGVSSQIIWYGPAGFDSGSLKSWLYRIGVTKGNEGLYTAVATYSSGCSTSAVISVMIDGPVLTTQPISPASYCAGTTVSLPFQTQGNFNSGNVFTVQLSDASGSFVSPVTIGSGTNSPIVATIPVGTPAGSGYLVRVVSSSPAANWPANATVLTINAPPGSFSASSNSPAGQVSVGGSISLTTSGQNLSGATYAWTGPNNFASTDANPAIAISTTANNGTYTVTLRTAGGCTVTAQTSVSLSTACLMTFDGEPLVQCDSAAADTTRQGKITVKVLNQPAGSTLRITLYQQTTVVTNGQPTYAPITTLTSSPAIFTGLTDGGYRVYAYALTGADTCRAGIRTLTVRCNSEPLNIRIKSVDAVPKETDKLPRVNGTLGTLKLSVEELDGQDLTGYTYLWTEPTSTSTTTTTATSSTLTASRIGDYKVTMVRGNDTLVAYITISALPCTECNVTYSSCKTVTISDPNATNSLANLAAGDIFYAGDYKVEVTQAISTGSGWTGEGTVEVTLINGFSLPAQVTFTDIKLNDCYELTGGAVITTYDPTWFMTAGTQELTEEVNDIGSKVNDLIATYTGVPEDKLKADEALKEIEETINSIQNNTELDQTIKDQMLDGLYNTQCVLQQISMGLDTAGKVRGGRVATSDCSACFPPTKECWDKVRKGVLDFISGVWDWAKKEVTCFDTYQQQKEFVPRCWWTDFNGTPAPNTLPAPLVAGFVDQLWEDTKGAVGAIAKHVTCFSPTYPSPGGGYIPGNQNALYFTKDCEQYRQAFNGIMPTAKQIILNQVQSLIDGTTLNEFINYVGDDSNCGDATPAACRYYKSGVILYNAIALYDGAKAGVALLKTGKALLQTAMKRTSHILANISRTGVAKVVSSLKGTTYYHNSIKLGTDAGQGLVLASRTDNIGPVVGTLDDVDVYNPSTKNTELVDVEYDNQGHCKVTGKCFVAGTLITTDKGLKPIERITTADWVLSRDANTGKQTYKSVVRTFVRQATKLAKIFTGNDTLVTTPEHPFRTGNSWIGSSGLHKGDILSQAQVAVAANVPDLPRFSLKVDSVAVLDTVAIVYNFEVADFHTYFVGRQSVWVHNDCVPELVEPGGQSYDNKNSSIHRPKKRNGNLEPNKIYNVDGFLYKTDAQGRVIEVTVDNLQLGKRGARQSTYSDQISEMNPRIGDDGGHLIGYQFDGPHEAINFVPMNNRINRNWKDPLPGEPDPPGAWYKMEKKWADALAGKAPYGTPQTVKIKIQIRYTTDRRPIAFEVKYTIGNGREVPVTFSN